MMRYLLALTAILGGAIADNPSQAAPPPAALPPILTPALAVPELKISGSTSFNSWFFHNDKQVVAGNIKDEPWKRQRFGRGQFFSMDDSRLRFTVTGKTDPGMDYGLVIVLDGDTDATQTLRENYLFFGGDWGKIFLGDTYGVPFTMAFGGFDQWGATGFLNGNFNRVIAFTTGALTSTSLVGDTSRDTKLTYLTPRWHGFQVGVSYTPRTEHRGEQKINSIRSVKSPSEPFDTDNIGTGLNFVHEFCDKFKVAFSATSIFGNTHAEYPRDRTLYPLRRKNTASFAFGGSIYYADIGFGVEYGNNGKSRQIAGQNVSNAGQFLDLGLSYTWGATKFSTGYYYGWRNALGAVNATLNTTTPLASPVLTSPYVRAKSRTHAVAAAVDHKLAPGLGVYFEYAHFQLTNPAAIAEANRNNAQLSPSGSFTGPIPSNRANAFVVGSRLVF